MVASSSSGKKAGRPAPSPHSWLSALIGICLWLGCVAATTGLVSGVVWGLRTSSTPKLADVNGWLWGSQDQKSAALREAYASVHPDSKDARWMAIEKFLGQLASNRSESKSDDWLEVLDEQRFRDRVMRSPWGRSQSLMDRRALAAQRIQQFSIESPTEFRQIDIVSIVPWGQGQELGGSTPFKDEVLVFTFADRGYSGGEPVLFWMHEVAGQWKLVDWEAVDGGLSEAESAALWAIALRDTASPQYTGAHDALRKADALPYSDHAEFERQLRRAELLSDAVISKDAFHETVKDQLLYMIINRWNNRSRYDEVRRVAKLFHDPDRIPGIHALNATACQNLGDPDEALAISEHVEQLVGMRASLLRLRARILQQLGRREDALSEWRRLADLEPDDSMHLIQLLRLLPKSRRTEVFDRIKSSKKPAELASQFALYDSDQVTTAEMRDLSDFVAKTAPDSSEAREIQIVRLKKEHMHREAAALYRQAIDRETDPLTKRQNWSGYLQEMNLAGELLAGFAEHPEPRTAFRILINGVDDDEMMYSIEDLAPLLAVYRQVQPDDPWLFYYEGHLASDDHRFADADAAYAKAETMALELKQAAKPAPAKGDNDDETESGGANDESERLLSEVRFRRCQARYELGEDVEILIHYKHDDSVYRTLANLAVQNRHWPALVRLNQEFAKHNRRDPWLIFYGARVSFGERDFPATREKLQSVQRREAEAPYLKYSREQLEREIAAAENSDPLAEFSQAVDQPAAFHRIANQLAEDKDWEKLDKLLELSQGTVADADLLMVRLDQVWSRLDDAKLIELLTPWPVAAMSKQSYLESTWRERMIRSLVRLHRWDEATEKAVVERQRFDNVWPLVMVLAAQRDAAGIARLLDDDEDLARSWSVRDFATDPLLRPILVDDGFAELRKDRPLALPVHKGGDSLLILMRHPQELSEQWLRDRFKLDQSDVDAPAEISQISPDLFVIKTQGTRFAVQSASQPFFSPEFVERAPFQRRRSDYPLEVKSVIDLQSAWLRIVRLSSDDYQPWNSGAMSAREAGAKLLTDQVVGAIYAPAYLYPQQSFLIPLGVTQSQVVASRRSFPDLDPHAVSVAMPTHPIRQDSEIKHRFLDLANHSPADGLQLTIQVRLGNQEIPLTAPFKVVAVRYGRFDVCEIVANYARPDAHPIFPEIRPGIQWIVSVDDVVGIEEEGRK